MSYLNKNFNYLLATDPHPEANGLPFLLSGVSFYVTYHRSIKSNGKFYYSDIGSMHYLNAKGDGGFDSIDEAVEIGAINPHLNEALGFTTLTRVTSDEPVGEDNKVGYYDFRYVIPPEISDVLEARARAEGYKFTSDNLIQLDKIGAYEKRRYDFKLVSAKSQDIGDGIENIPEESKPTEEVKPNAIFFGFENAENLTEYGWENFDVYSSAGAISDKVVWQIVNSDNLPLTNQAYKDLVGDTTITSILPAYEGNQYLWFGNSKTGTYNDNSSSNNSTQEIAGAVVSPVIDFSNLSLAKVSLKAWYEISGQDQDFLDLGFIGFMLPANEYDGKEEVYFDWYDTELKTNYLYIRKVTPTFVATLPGTNDTILVSNMGENTQPMWANYEMPLHILAGKKAQIVFGFFASDNQNNNLRGFGVDNILVYDDVKEATTQEGSGVADCLPGQDCTTDSVTEALEEDVFVPANCLPGMECK